MVEGAGTSPKKSLFVPKMKVWVHFAAVFTGRKDGHSLEALGHGFYGSIAKRSLQIQCKNYPETHGLTKGGDSNTPPLLYTPLVETDEEESQREHAFR